MSDNENITVDTALLRLLSIEQAWRYRLIPMQNTDDAITFYADNETELAEIQDELEIILNKEIKFLKKPSSEINQGLYKYYRREVSKQAIVGNTLKNDDFLVNLISEAKSVKSSDIHIEAYENKNRIRFRIDGQLIERYIINSSEYPGLINRVKIMADLDISERRLPQDGRIFFNHNSEKFDIRVSSLPVLHGEKIVLRLLGNDASYIDVNTLGFTDTELSSYLMAVQKSNGIVLISGPTGSGKTTTLYATLKILNKETKNILTIEDPIEYTLEGINQVQLKESIGLSFASALRTFLRQDPDIIMLCEIRDSETATMAIRASLTGHLVLSTIHTNSAIGIISRLIDMGVPNFLIADTLNIAVAQRLIRLLCPHCKRQSEFDSVLHNNLPIQIDVKTEYLPVGCDSCYFTGYKGRKALYEVVLIDNDFKNMIKNDPSALNTLQEEKKINTLAKNALSLFSSGLTSWEEVFPILMSN